MLTVLAFLVSVAVVAYAACAVGVSAGELVDSFLRRF